VEIGLGISIVTDLCLTGRERVAKMPLGEYFPDRSYGIVLRRGKFLSPQAKRFLEVVKEVFAARDEQAGLQ
jgi:DNA-binding transcriptional LysR family regulator